MAEWIALAEIATQPRHGRSVALHDAAVQDHAAFRAQAARWRAACLAHPGKRLALYFDAAADFAPALFGAWHAGKTVYLCADVLPATLATLQTEVDGFLGDIPPAYAPLSPTIGGVDAGEAWPPLDEHRCQLQIYTSGSTGDTSAITKSLAQLAREVEALQAAFPALPADVVVHGTVSHQHIYGLLFRVLWPLAAGRVLAPRLFFHEEIAAALQQPAILVSSPAHLKRIPDTLNWTLARHQLAAVFSSGGALPEVAAAQAHALWGLPVTEIYGSSETGGIAWRQSEGHTAPWQPLPEVAWRIAENEVLEVASPHLTTPAWWPTCDRVEAVGNGGFKLLGRVDRIVKVEERRVSLTALERQLLTLPEVAEARVVLLDGMRAELAAVVVPSAHGQERLQAEGAQRLGQQLRLALADGQEAVTRPRRWRFVDALPMTAQGKTPESALRALFRPLRPTPRWVVRTSQQAVLELNIEADLLVFDGHFPQAPILPGVAQLDWAVRFGREAFAIPPHFLRMDALKFQRVVRPGMQIQLQLEWQPHTAVLTFRYTSEHGAHASGRAVFAAADATGAAP